MSNNITQITDFVNTQNVNRLIDLYNVFKQNNHFPSLTEAAIKDLIKSGLEPEIVREAGIFAPTKSDLEKYHIHWFDKNRRQERFIPLYVIPYLTAEWDDFCRVKVIPNKDLFDGKYTQPSSQHLKYSCHLYILPSELEKLKSPKCKLFIVEGEKKALKLIQEIRKIEDDLGYKVAVVGIAGINNWQTAPEWKKIDIKGREAVLFFDADAEYNKAVVEAELELAGFLYSKGAGAVKSSVWNINDGKGIDDLLVNAENETEKLKELLDNTISVFEKYKNRFQDKELLKAFFKYPIRVDKTRLEYLTNIVREETNAKKQLIKAVITSLQIEYEYELQEKQQQQIRTVFGLDRIEIPKPFIWERGRLKTTKEDDLSDFFIVKDRVVNQDGEVVGITIKTIKNREFFVSIDELNKKHLHYVFTKNDTILAEPNNNLVLKYIALYQSYNPVNIRRLIERTGWIKDEYYLPQLFEEFEFHEDLKGFRKVGDKQKELELMKELIEGGYHVGLGYAIGLGAVLVGYLNTDNFTVFLQGKTGKGKSTTNFLGLSLFGFYRELQSNLNRTSTGIEILLDRRRDVLNVLEEVNTGQGDVAKDIVKTIYDFENRKGRTRAKVNLSLRKTSEYRGILSISSEDSLSHLLSKADKTVKGALRRVVAIDFTEFRDVDKTITDKVYSTIDNNYGNLIEDFIAYLKNNKNEVYSIYHTYISEMRKRYKLNGQERHFAVLFTAAELVNRVFNINTDSLKSYLYQIADYNAEQFEEATVLTEQRLRRKIIEFIHNNIGNFEYVNIDEITQTVIEKNIPKKAVYGKLEDGSVYFTSLGLQELASFIQIPEKELKVALVKFGFADKDKDRIIKRTMKSIAGMSAKTYEIKLNEKDEDKAPAPPPEPETPPQEQKTEEVDEVFDYEPVNKEKDREEELSDDVDNTDDIDCLLEASLTKLYTAFDDEEIINLKLIQDDGREFSVITVKHLKVLFESGLKDVLSKTEKQFLITSINELLIGSCKQ